MNHFMVSLSPYDYHSAGVVQVFSGRLDAVGELAVCHPAETVVADEVAQPHGMLVPALDLHHHGVGIEISVKDRFGWKKGV